MNAAGAFMVVWRDSYYEGVGGRVFDASGTPVGAEIRMGADDPVANDATVTADDSGQFVVAWQHSNSYGIDDGLYLYGEHIRTRPFDPAGNALGPEFVSSTHWTYSLNKGKPSIATRTPGRFIVAWESSVQDGSDYGIYARSPDVLFVDAFETGMLASWAAVSDDAGDLAITSAAKMTSPPSRSVLGLQAVVDDTAAVHLQDDSPAAESRYRARFYFDPNGFDPGEAIGQFRQRIFVTFSEAPMKRLVLLMVRRMGGQFALGAQVRRDDDTLAKPPFVLITDGPHAVEIDWHKATAAGANDGRFEMWIDGTSVVTVTGLDNDDRPVDFVRMGAISVKAGASGALYFDEFVSRRLAYIGP